VSAMGSSKGPSLPHQPGAYRDDPDRDDAASTSSAVLLGEIDGLPEEDLPSYTDSQVHYTDEAPSTTAPSVSDGAPYVRRGPGGPTYNPYISISPYITNL
jgi:hypothetical protein